MDKDNARLLSDYRYHLKVERNLSVNSVSAYCSDISHYMENAGSDVAKASGKDIAAYLSTLSCKIGSRSQARTISALRSFYDFLILEGERKDNPCDSIDNPKIGRRLPEVLSVEEVEAIIASVHTDSWQGLRDRAILELLYACEFPRPAHSRFRRSMSRNNSSASLERATRRDWCRWAGWRRRRWKSILP